MIKIEILKSDKFTFKQLSYNNAIEPNVPRRTTFHKSLLLEIDQGPQVGRFTKWTLPIHDFDVFKLSTTRTLQIDEVKTNESGKVVYLANLNLNCFTASGREWGLSITSNHPQFEEFRSFLETFL